MKKSLLIYPLLALLIFACVGSDDDNNPCVYLPLLETQVPTEITETSATLNGLIDSDSNNCNTIPNSTEQGFVYSTTIQPTINDIVVNVNGSIINALIENLEPNTTYYIRTFITSALGSFYGNEVNFTTLVQQCDVVYLANNGITIKAYECATVGDLGIVNGVEYTIVDREMLDQMIDNGGDLTKVCTTRVTDMSDLFVCHEIFNQTIGSWDVSNVTTMNAMFYSECEASQFNQDISQWNVSNVTDMYAQFNGGVFNQPIGDWDVSNVTDMSYMFIGAASFNQPIGGWNVSNVTTMNAMFNGAASFNQPIGGWNVSNVTSMSDMFYEAASFNQDLANWDVSNVTNMSDMFNKALAFNGNISSWNVSEVTDMRAMFFQASAFNQVLTNWYTINVISMRAMFYEAASFNQDLANWNVQNVTDCTNFDFNTPQWILPKPGGFNNCI